MLSRMIQRTTSTVAGCWGSSECAAFCKVIAAHSSLAGLTSQGRLQPRRRGSTDASSLPYHLVVGLPALSPTMASGSLAEWYVSEGDKFSAGDALAKIETDKATIDFEAQDDGYVARLLMEAATGNDVSVGTPIMVTVEEEENIAAFKDYVAPPSQKVASEVTPSAAESALSPTPPPPPPPSALAAALAPKEPSAAAASSAPSSPAPPAPAAVVSPPSVFPSSSAPSTPAVVPWGSMVATSSPLARTLSKSQRKYVELYGSTGQVPIL